MASPEAVARPAIRLLAICDDPTGDRLRSSLTGRPFEATVCGLLEDAQEILEETGFDAVLVDLDRWGLDALEALIPYCGITPVLVLSRAADESEGVAAIRRGAVDHLADRPATFQALPRILRYVVERAEMSRRVAHVGRLAAVGEMTAGIAHELANPIAVLGLNETHLTALFERAARGEIEPDVAFEEALEVLRENEDGLIRIRTLLGDLTSFSRPDEVRRAESVDLAVLVERVGRLMRKPVEDRARLTVNVSPVPEIRGDARRLQQVLVNLVVNARDATPEGASDARITLFCRTRGETILVGVEDEGVGVPDELRTRIFEPFFTTKGDAGTGLGLSLSSEIVRQHGGELSVERGKPRGSVFTLTFPVEAAPAARPDQVRRARILVMDDDEIVLRALDRVLRKDHDVETVSTLEVAKELLRTQEFDLVYADMMMPGGGGPELHAFCVRECPRYLDRLVFVTGNYADERIAEFIESVPNSVLHKPVDQRFLRYLAQRALLRGVAAGR